MPTITCYLFNGIIPLSCYACGFGNRKGIHVKIFVRADIGCCQFYGSDSVVVCSFLLLLPFFGLFCRVLVL